MSKSVFSLKWVYILLILIIFAYFIKKVYVSFFLKVKTEVAKVEIFDEFIDAEALIVRNEKMLKNSCDFLKLICRNNSKISKGQLLAKIFLSEKALRDDVSFLEGTFDLSDFNKNSDKISNIIRKIAYKNFIPSLNKASCDGSKNCDGLFSDSVGIFSCHADGFEDILNMRMNDSEIKQININEYKKNIEIGKNIIGKLIKNEKCMIICFIKNKIKLNKNSFYIKFELNHDLIEGNLIKILDVPGDKQILLFLSDINNFILNCRYENVKIRLNSAEGLKIYRKCIHKINDVDGVFVLDRKVVKFKPIDIIYNHIDFVLCKYDEFNNESIQKNDLIITNNNNLYDGKIIIT